MDAAAWTELVLRWFHIFTAILWIGQTWLFLWMDRQMAREGEVWMVHGGGFYAVRRETRGGGQPLHWFRWEAALTWLSGVALLALVYYYGGLMTAGPQSRETAMLAGAAAIVLGWPVYELLWRSPLGRSEWLGGAVSLAALAALAWGLARLMPARAAYMHVGATMGTIMAANVWLGILPAQRRMVAALAQRREPDWALGERAKRRSRHNTYLVVPVVLVMISSHYPMTYGDREWGWAILTGLIVLGWAGAWLARRL